MEKIDDLRKLDMEKLKSALSEARIKLMDKKLNRSSGKDKDTTLFRTAKKHIAKLQTLMKEKEALK